MDVHVLSYCFCLNAWSLDVVPSVVPNQALLKRARSMRPASGSRPWRRGEMEKATAAASSGVSLLSHC